MRWSENPFIIADNQSSISATIIKNLNHPLPWFGVFALIVVFCTAQSYQAKDTAEVARQTAWKAETESMMLREHVDQLRMELANHGIMPPPYPKELKK